MEYRVLREISDIQIPSTDDPAGVRLLKSRHKLQQGRFPCSVDSDETDFVTFVDGKVGVIKEQPLRI